MPGPLQRGMFRGLGVGGRYGNGVGMSDVPGVGTHLPPLLTPSVSVGKRVVCILLECFLV